MAANTNPIFVKTPKIGFGKLTAANTAKDGTGTLGTDIISVYTAGVEGGRVESIRFLHLGTNVQTVARIFVNNGAGNNIATNNTLIGEITISANTVSETDGQSETEYVFIDGLVLPAGYQILVTIGTAVAAGIQITAFGGDF